MADDLTVDPSLRKKLEEVKMYDEPSSPGLSKVKEWIDVNLRGQAPIEIKFPSELKDALSDTQRLHVFDHFGRLEYKIHGNTDRYLKPEHIAEVSVITRGQEYHWPISWNIDDDGAWIVFKDPLHLIEMISALAPLCQKVEHIVIGFCDDRFFLPDRLPVIPMRSVLSVYLYSMIVRLHVSLQTVSMCFPNAKSLVQECEMAISFRLNFRHHFGISLSSLRRLELRIARNHDTLDNLFLLLSSSCQNIESLTVTSDTTLKCEKSSTAIRECKLPNLTDIHLQSSWSGKRYTFQLLADLLHVGRVMSPSLRFVKVESVQLGYEVLTSVEWSRTSSDCGLHIQGASLLSEELAFGWSLRDTLRKSAAVPITWSIVPITELIDITTSEFKEVTVLTLVSCKTVFGQSESKSPQSPNELGTLREIRFVGSENPLSESDRNKLSELYPNVKVTENRTSQESSVESQEGAGIPSKLDKASSQSLKTSAIDELVEEKVEFHEDTGSQNPEGGEEETSWQEKGEEFDVNQGSLPHESGDVEITKKECCKRVGADGGILQLESFGIELEIPPGAINSKEPQEIFLRVLTDTPNLGDTEEEMSVCFGVQCLAPDDLVLRSPVTYTIPHCAVANRYSSLEAVLYTGEGEYTSDAVKERKILSRSGIPSCKIMKDVLELKMDHFSWAKIKIRIKNFFFRGKEMCLWPFKQMNLPLAKRPVILHAHLLNDVMGNKEVEEKEKINHFIPAHIDIPVLVQKAEVDLEMGCYVKEKLIGNIAVVSFEKLRSGTRICVDFELDLDDHPDIVAVAIKAGQTKDLEVRCLIQLDFPIPQGLEKVSPLDAAKEYRTSSSQTQQTSIQMREGTKEMNPARKKDFDDILKTVAKKVTSRQDIDDLGKALGFGPEDINRYVEENNKGPGVSYIGTLSMLRDWSKKQTNDKDRKALRTALEKADQIRLAEELFRE